MCSRVAASVAYATGSWDVRDPMSKTTPTAGLIMPDVERLNDTSLLGHWMVVNSYEEYEELAVNYGSEQTWAWKQVGAGAEVPAGFIGGMFPINEAPTHVYVPEGGVLAALRRNLFLGRDSMSLFDTTKWVRNLETGLVDAWDRFAKGWDIQQTRNRAALGLGPDAPDSVENTARGQRYFNIQ
jgi:hypothetical protein